MPAFGLQQSPVGQHALHPGGLIHSAVPGRTDQLRIAVPNESHIIPADIVSSLGQGNTMAGAKMLDQMFRRQQKAGLAHGGHVHGGLGPVPIVAAGGEYAVTPEEVAALGGGDMKRGHDLIDQMIKRVREYTIKRLKTLPPPKK